MEHYDAIIIGTGAGGGARAQKLAPRGKQILLLERGGYLPVSRRSREVFRKERYLDDDPDRASGETLSSRTNN